MANGGDYEDIPALIDALTSRHDAALFIEQNHEKANGVLIEQAALADLVSEFGDNAAIEDFGITIEFPSVEIRRAASKLKEHWMTSHFSRGRMVLSE